METVKLQKQMRPMLGKRNLRKLLKKYYPLLAILIGVSLISIAMGPYLTLDTDLEFSTAQGVLHWGYPYINAWGNLFNDHHWDSTPKPQSSKFSVSQSRMA
jgi:hypothetical protein